MMTYFGKDHGKREAIARYIAYVVLVLVLFLAVFLNFVILSKAKTGYRLDADNLVKVLSKEPEVLESIADFPAVSEERIVLLKKIFLVSGADVVRIINSEGECVGELSDEHGGEGGPTQAELDRLLDKALSGEPVELPWWREYIIIRVLPVLDKDNNTVGKVGVAFSFDELGGDLEWLRVVLLMILPLSMGAIMAILLIERRKREVWYANSFEKMSSKLQEQEMIFNSIEEIIFMVDGNEKLLYLNKHAKNVIKKIYWHDGDVNINWQEEGFVKKALAEKKAVHNFETVWHGCEYLINAFPIFENEKFSGVVFVARALTEIKAIAERLTSAQSYVDTLRAQTHEFMNQLFIIDGLAKLGHFEEMRQYIANLTGQHEKDVAEITNKIRDKVIAGLLLGKLSKGREMGIETVIRAESYLPELYDVSFCYDLSVIISNLFDNACEATIGCEEKMVYLLIVGGNNQVEVTVDDSGCGMSEELQESIFELGFSTKTDEEEKHGLGMFLVKSIVEKYNGYIEVCSEEGQGSSITCVVKCPDTKQEMGEEGGV